MNRRGFLSSTILTGIAGVAGATFAGTSGAKAFSTQDCTTNQGAACQELIRHQELLADLDAKLTAKGLSPSQKHVILAAAICPFCGQPLM